LLFTKTLIYFVFQSTFIMNKQPINQLDEIKNLMERSSRFISLSGLSGVFAGITALIGSAAAFFILDYDLRYFKPDAFFGSHEKYLTYWEIGSLLVLAAAIFVVAVFCAFIFTARKAKKQGMKMWNHTSKLLLINLAIPLVTGGLFSLLLIYYRLIFLVAPITLIFYGLSLINAGKYTLSEIRWLGVSEVILGLIATVIPGYGLFVWAIGFGILHIIYGIIMYFKYDHQKI
jgi:hypothetical protein